MRSDPQLCKCTMTFSIDILTQLPKQISIILAMNGLTCRKVAHLKSGTITLPSEGTDRQEEPSDVSSASSVV